MSGSHPVTQSPGHPVTDRHAVTRSPLRVCMAEGERYNPLYERLPEWEKQSGYAVEVTAMPLRELLDHLETTLLQYHLVSGYSQYTPGMASMLAPLDELLPPEEIRDFAAPALEMCRWQGRVYALPRSVEPRLLFYRSDIFEDRREKQWFADASQGRELRVPRTWEELAAVAQYFTREGRMFGFAFPGRHSGLVATFAEILTTTGGTFFDAEGRPRFYSRAGEWSLNLLRDLLRRWEAVPPETPHLDYEDVSDFFRMGQCAMACDFPGTARLLHDPTFSAVAAWHSVALYPAGPDGRRAVWTGCPTFAIPELCPDKEAAVDLLLFLTGHDSQMLEGKDGAIPSRVSTYRQLKESLREGTLGHLRFTVAEQTLRLAVLTAPKLPRYRQIEERLWPLLQEAIQGHREVAEALEMGVKAAEELVEAPSSETGGGN